MRFRVQFSSKARHDYDTLPVELQLRIREKLEDLCADPYAHRLSKAMKGQSGVRIARVGDHRILFLVVDENEWIVIDRIRHRSVVYKRFR